MKHLDGGIATLPWGTIAAAVMALAVVLVVSVAVLRAMSGRKARRRRLEFALLPDPEFETSVEEVIRLAAQLGRVRRASGLIHHPDGNSVRLRFRSIDDGRLVSSIVVPEAAAPGLRRAMYPMVETRPINEIVDTPRRSVDRYRKRSSGSPGHRTAPSTGPGSGSASGTGGGARRGSAPPGRSTPPGT